MKKTFAAIMICLLTSVAAQAQAYTESRYYNPATGKLDYNRKAVVDRYYGFRLGVNSSSVSSDNKYLGCDNKAGLNVGFVYGFGLTASDPLYLETGFAYTEKGGKSTKEGVKYSYNLDYMELPFVVKYMFDTDWDVSIQPFFGGYFACGVGGKIKNYGTREAYDSFSDNDTSFRRFDAGLRLGVGVGYELMYIDVAYELGLANTSHDTFDTAHNRCLTFSLGVNF